MIINAHPADPMFCPQRVTTQVPINTNKAGVGKSDTRGAAYQPMQLTRLNPESAQGRSGCHPLAAIDMPIQQEICEEYG